MRFELQQFRYLHGRCHPSVGDPQRIRTEELQKTTQ